METHFNHSCRSWVTFFHCCGFLRDRGEPGSFADKAVPWQLGSPGSPLSDASPAGTKPSAPSLSCRQLRALCQVMFSGGDVPLEGLGSSTQQQKQSCGSLPLCSWGGLVPRLEVCITSAKCANRELEYFPS